MVENVTLTEAQCSDLNDSFALFDKDGNGTISPEELLQIMHSTLGSTCPGPNRVRLVFQELDKDNSGSISFEEFLTLITDKKFQDSGKDELRETFDMFDKDQNGYICDSELRTVMDSLGEKLRDDEIEQMVQAADSDGDKKIDFEEFKMMVKSA